MTTPASILEPLITEMLEQFAFARVNPRQGEFTGWGSDELFWAEITLKAPYADRMTLALPATLAQQLTVDAWGGIADEEMVEQAITDFLSELGNTLAGGLLAKMHPGQPIELGLPQSGRGPRSAPVGQNLHFDVEGHPLCVTLKNAA